MRSQLKQIFVDSDSRGFTLIEVLIVVAIIATIVTISMPNMKTWQAHARVNGDARSLLGAFQQARLEAVKRNEFCAVAFGQVVGGKTYDYVVFFDRTEPYPNKVYDAADDDIYRKADFAYASWVSTFPGVGAAIFNSRGLPSTSTISTGFNIGSIELSGADGYTRIVRVSKSGRIKIE